MQPSGTARPRPEVACAFLLSLLTFLSSCSENPATLRPAAPPAAGGRVYAGVPLEAPRLAPPEPGRAGASARFPAPVRSGEAEGEGAKVGISASGSAGAVRQLFLENISSGDRVMWTSTGGTVTGTRQLGYVPPAWQIRGGGEVNGDGKRDLVWQDTTSGVVAFWYLDGTGGILSTVVLGQVPAEWRIMGVGDYNGDGNDDLLWWHEATGTLAFWYLDGHGAVLSTVAPFGVPAPWRPTAARDLNGDGKDDILWENTSAGTTAVWYMSGGSVAGSASLASVPPVWRIVGTADLDGDGHQDILWQNAAAGGLAVWYMDGAGSTTSLASLPQLPSGYRVGTALDPLASVPAPVLDPIAGATLQPGDILTLTGRNFSPTASANTVTIAGVAATVTSASATQLSVQVPARGALPCASTHDVPIVVSVGGQATSQSHALNVGVMRSLASGQALLVSAPGEMACTELPAGGKYVLAIYNVGTPSSTISAFHLGGAENGATASASGPGLAPGAAGVLRSTEPDPHARALDASRDLVRQLGLPPRGAAARRGARTQAATGASYSVGQVVMRRLPVNGSSYSCSSPAGIAARVKYVGTHVLIMEDTLAPLAGQVDTLYQKLGDEYEAAVYPVLTGNFGDPAAYDASLDADGRIQLVFTSVVNGTGNLGFVWSGDFYPRTMCQSSNVDETAYIYVPLVTGSGPGTTMDAWWRQVRGTVAHEAKHVTAYSERLARGQSLEESWLEEGSAMIAEEIWSRPFAAHPQFGNAGAAVIYCDIWWSDAACAGKPRAMLDHFGWLVNYYGASETHSVFGGASASDGSYYGSAWWLVRYAADQSGQAESAFFKALVQGGLTGTTNLTTQARMSLDNLLGYWSLMLALDDRAGFTSADPRLGEPSWNSVEILSDWGPPPFLGQTHAVGASFSLDVSTLRGGGVSIVETGTIGTGGQALRLAGSGSASLPSNVRLGIARLQ